MPLNVPIGSGHDFKGVVSTLNMPADRGGAGRPGPINEALLEAIIEVDEAVTERYFEGKPPTREEIGRLIVEAVAAGEPDPYRLRGG